MPLTMARPGECVTIKRITGKDDTVKFLNRLGLIEGHPGHSDFQHCRKSDTECQRYARCAGQKAFQPYRGMKI